MRGKTILILEFGDFCFEKDDLKVIIDDNANMEHKIGKYIIEDYEVESLCLTQACCAPCKFLKPHTRACVPHKLVHQAQ